MKFFHTSSLFILNGHINSTLREISSIASLVSNGTKESQTLTINSCTHRYIYGRYKYGQEIKSIYRMVTFTNQEVPTSMPDENTSASDFKFRSRPWDVIFIQCKAATNTHRFTFPRILRVIDLPPG